MTKPVRRKTRRSNVVGGEDDQPQVKRRKRRTDAPSASPRQRARKKSEEEAVEEPVEQRADDILDEAKEDDDKDSGQLLFESQETISEDGLRFWGHRSALSNLVQSAGDYTSGQLNAARYMTEVTVRVNPEEQFVSATGESEFDAGAFFLYHDFETSASEEFWFSIDANHLLTALDIVSGESVTLELIPDEENEGMAELWVLDETSTGQNTNFTVTIPNEDQQPRVPEGIQDERVEFQPEAWLSAYSEVERCRDSSGMLQQIFSSIGEEDGMPYIRFIATDQAHVATSRSWLDEHVGEELDKINFHPDAINKAVRHLNEGTSATMMVSSEDDDIEEEEWEGIQSQSSRLVILETKDTAGRVLSKIKLSTLVPSNNDLEAQIADSIRQVLDSTVIMVNVNYAKLAKAISNAGRVHALNPESQNEQTVHLVIEDDEITVRSHNVKRPDFGTRSVHKISPVDDSGKNNEEFGNRDIMGLLTTYSLNIVQRFDPADMNDNAVLAFFKREGSEHINGVTLLRTEEAKEWNEDDDHPKFVTAIMGSSDESIHDD